MHQILLGKTKIAEKDLPKPSADKLKTFYDACMDTAFLEKQGVKPMKAFIKKHISGIKDAKSFMVALAKLGELGHDRLFGFGIDTDQKRPLVHITSIWQDGLGLPDRSYYLKNKKGVDVHKEVRDKKYRPLIEFGLGQADIGTKGNAEISHKVLEFETSLAKATVDRLKLRDPIKTYHMLSQAELYKLSPLMKHYFDARKGNAYFWKASPKIFTTTPTFFQQLSPLISKTPVSVLKGYLQWHLTKGLVYGLSDKQSLPYWKFYSQGLSGVKKRSKRWKQCYYSARSNLRDIFARAFVAKLFPGKSKAAAQSMVNLLVKTFTKSLKSLTWLDDATRRKALVKLSALVDMIGYPAKWRAYKKAVIGRCHFSNKMALAKVSSDH